MRTSTSPTTAESGIINSLGWQIVVATPPIVHHGFMTVCPPVTVVPASRAQSYISNIITLDRSGIKKIKGLL